MEDLLSKTAVARQYALDAPTLAVYVSQIAELDGSRYVPDDVRLACLKIARDKRGEFETQFPTLGEVLERIDSERKLRTRESSRAACDERMAKQLAFAESVRIERETEWNERKKYRELSSSPR